MRILLDREGLSRLSLVSAANYADQRHYYVASDELAIAVARNGIKLGVEIANQVADCAIGWDGGTRGFVFEQNEGKRHNKIAIFRLLGRTNYAMTLSQFLRDAPKE